jgi:hypothetical protein
MNRPPDHDLSPLVMVLIAAVVAIFLAALVGFGLGLGVWSAYLWLGLA